MRILLDSNIVLALTRRSFAGLPDQMRFAVDSPASEVFVSAASLWEIAIKTRLGKLDPAIPLEDIPAFLEAATIRALPVAFTHAIADLAARPATRDPFDRLLLAQCQVENLRLVTMDRELAQHPLAWKPA